MTGRELIDKAVNKLDLQIRKLGVARAEDYWNRDDLLSNVNAIYQRLSRGSEFEVVPVFTTITKATDSINTFYVEATDASVIKKIYYGYTELVVRPIENMSHFHGTGWETAFGTPTVAVLMGMYSQVPGVQSLCFSLYPKVESDDTQDDWTEAEIVEFMNTMFTRNFTALDTDYNDIEAQFPAKHDEEPCFAYINKTLVITDEATNIPVVDEVCRAIIDGVCALYLEEIPTEPAQILAKIYGGRFADALTQHRKDSVFQRDKERKRSDIMP